MKMVKRVVSIEAGVWWTKVALADYRKKNPPVHKAFAFRTPEHAVEDGYIRDKEAFASALKAELSRHDIHEKEVVFTLSSSKVVSLAYFHTDGMDDGTKNACKNKCQNNVFCA